MGKKLNNPTKATIYPSERTSETFNECSVGGLKWSVAKEPMCGHYPWILARVGYPAHMSDLTRTASGGAESLRNA